MNLQHWLIYLSVVAAIIATPGPSAALCVTQGAAQGKYRTIATVLGGMLASMILMSLLAMGLGVVIAIFAYGSSGGGAGGYLARG